MSDGLTEALYGALPDLNITQDSERLARLQAQVHNQGQEIIALRSEIARLRLRGLKTSVDADTLLECRALVTRIGNLLNGA